MKFVSVLRKIVVSFEREKFARIFKLPNRIKVRNKYPVIAFFSFLAAKSAAIANLVTKVAPSHYYWRIDIVAKYIERPSDCIVGLQKD